MELRDWINGILDEAQKAKASNAETQAKLDASVKDATNLANECAADKECAKAPLACWFHRLMRNIFWILGGIVVLLIGLVVLNVLFPFVGAVLGGLLTVWRWIVGALSKLRFPKVPPNTPPPPTPPAV